MSETRLRAFLIDDEPLALTRLARMLEATGRVDVVGRATDPTQGLAQVSGQPIDVLFLDIHMPGLSGFEVVERVPPGPAVVFTTAHDQHAVRAFEVNAVDYLLKPVEAGRLEQALQRARKRVETDRQVPDAAANPSNDQIERIVKMMAARQVRRDQVAIKVGDRLMLVQAEEIIFASLTDESINIVTGQVTGTSNYRTLDDLQARLDPDVFWRVHRSHLVNINKIKEIVPWFSRNFILRMKDTKGSEIPVSRSQTKRLREYLKL
jgi:two-component system, LytTR family, response regulator